MKRNIYADNAATTKLDEVAFSAMKNYMLNDYGNASQPYSFARTSKKALWKSREIIADCINSNAEEIFFTSGGTESDNWVIKKFGSTNQKKVIIASEIEHHAILNSCEEIRDDLHEIIFLPVDKEGVVSTELLIKTLAKYHNLNVQMLVSIMMANNEIGTIEPIKELAAITHKYGAFFHTDAVQALGHIKVDVRDLNVDFLSASSHKFNGPKGTGFLFVKKGSPIKPFISGGYQEQGNRAGTENVAAVVGMATALQENVCNIEGHRQLLLKLEETLIQKLKEYNLDFIQNGDRSHLPGIVSLSFKGQNGELILHRMDLMGCCISTGSACDSVNNQISHVIKAIQVPKEYAEGTIRISFGKYNTLNDAADIATMINSIINVGLQKQG